jgi:PAS domain S-box-containing protein
LFFIAYSIINEHINEEVEKEVAIALQFELAIRSYVADRIRSLMYDLVGKLKKFYSSLEMQVKERTMALELANDQLRREISDRQKVEEALSESEKKYRTVLATNPDPVVVDDKEGKVIYFNHAFTRVFGWHLEQCIDKKMDFFVPEQNWTETRMMIEKVKAGEDFSGIESRRFTKQGEIVDVSLSATVYRDSAGSAIGSIVNLRDITEKKRLRAEAMRAGHLTSLGELAAGVAHEINNPISGIIGYAEVLKDTFEEQGQDDDIPKKIIKEGERIAEIVKNLLSFARDREEEHSPAKVTDILSDALGLIEKRIIKDGIKFSVHIPDDLPKVKARSKEIQQVFLNVISNARYALNQRYPEPHEENVSEITGEIADIQGRKYVRIIFYDRGIGMPGNIVNRISDPFFSTKSPGEGAGLGLSISHGILQNHGGRLWFESVEGEYTEVVVDLPVDNE